MTCAISSPLISGGNGLLANRANAFCPCSMVYVPALIRSIILARIRLLYRADVSCIAATFSAPFSSSALTRWWRRSPCIVRLASADQSYRFGSTTSRTLYKSSTYCLLFLRRASSSLIASCFVVTPVSMTIHLRTSSTEASSGKALNSAKISCIVYFFCELTDSNTE